MAKRRSLLLSTLFCAGVYAVSILPARASVLGAYYFAEQIKLNNLGYTQNILPVTMPSGKTCRISYFRHRSSRGKKRHVLLHGFLDRSLTWRHTILKMPEGTPLRKNLVLVDLPHHGDSTCSEVNSFETAETFLVRGLNAIRERERFKVDGIWTGSLGGLFGLALLNTYPEAQLTMIVPPLLASPYAGLKTKEISSITTPDALRNFLAKVPPPNKQLPLMGSIVSGLLPRAQAAKLLVHDIRETRLWQGYNHASNPIRIMVSQDDRLLPLNEMDSRFTHNRKSIFQVIEGCGHSILRFCSDRAVPFLLQEETSQTALLNTQPDLPRPASPQG